MMHDTIFSPARLEVLLHYYYSPEPHPDFRRAEATIPDLIDEGLMQVGSQFDAVYSLTDRGQAYVKMLLETPYPIQVWIDPRTETK